ncbi:MAG: ester cyclase [Candidatus Bathyarchaeota archaeon]|nr:MAG: ester cyclase [Candidatus Bathyarchaeota archaeon]
MSLEDNKAIIRKVIDAVNNQDLALLDELIAPDFVYHRPTQQIQGLDVMKQGVMEELRSFPDLHVNIEDIMAEGEKVCVRLTETATHKAPFRGLAPSGQKLTYTVMTIWRIAEGKVVEGWGVYDQMDFFKQLGVIEYKGFPDEG